MARNFTSTSASAEQFNPLDGFTFTLDDVMFTCLGRLSILRLSDLARRVSGSGADLEDAPPQVQASMIGSMSETLLMALGPPEYQRFIDHCDKHHTDDLVIIDIVQMINEQIQSAAEQATGRPTGLSSPSSDGAGTREGQMSRLVSAGFGEVTVIPPAADHKQPKAQGSARPGRRPAKGGRRAAG